MITHPVIERQAFGDAKVQLGEVSHPDDMGMLTAEQAAAYLGVSKPKLTRLVQQGRLGAYVPTRDRRKRLFRTLDLDVLRPQVVDVANDWISPDDPDTQRALAEVEQRVAKRGLPPGPDGYSLDHLLQYLEGRRCSWRVEKLSGPWRFGQGDPPVYEGSINRHYEPGVGGLTIHSFGYAPAVAMLRSIDQLLDDEATGASRLY